MIPDQGRPNDVRGFVHRKLFGLGKGLVKRGAQFVGAAGIPGVSGAVRFATSLTSGGSRNVGFNRAVGRAIGRGQGIGNQETRFRPGAGGIFEDQLRARQFASQVSGGNGSTAVALAAGNECPRGFHPNKSTYRLVTSGELVPEGSRCVRNRRRNPDNGRASLRAARRLLARQKHAKTIDDALRSLAPRKSSRSRPQAARGAPLVIQN